MKCLNTQAKLIIQKLYESMYDPKYMIEEGCYAKINNNDSFMPVVIEKTGYLEGYGEIISIAHYGLQNGDLMADPEMELVIIQGDYFPITFRNDYLCQQQEVFIFNDDGTLERINLILQSYLTTFANKWMRNIANQQEL